MAKFVVNDALVMLRGLTAVSRAAINVTENELKEAWHHSSVRTGLRNVNLDMKNQNVFELLNEVKERSFAATKGLSEFSSVAIQKLCDKNSSSTQSKDFVDNIGDTYAGKNYCEMPMSILYYYTIIMQL